MPNIGIAPTDPTTPLGQTRGIIGDTLSIPLDPDVAGQGAYPRFGDIELLSFLAQGGQSPLRATAYAYLQLAAGVALTAKRATATDDLKIGASAGPDGLLAIAARYFAMADEYDNYFEIIDGPRVEREFPTVEMLYGFDPLSWVF